MFLKAANQGSLENVKRLCQQSQVKVDTPDENHRIGLTLACDGGHKAVVQYLLDRNAKVEGSPYIKWTPLLSTAKGGHVDIVRLLLDRNTIVQATDDNDWTPLIHAVNEGHAGVVRLLLNCNADIEARLIDLETSLLLACEKGHSEVVNVLLDCGVNVEVQRSDLDCVDLTNNLQHFETSIGRGQLDQSTPLIIAARRDNADIARLLLDPRANIEASDSDGWISLMIAARHGNVEFARVLLDRNAKKNIETKLIDQSTALIFRG